MLRFAQGLLMVTYAVLPPAMLAWAILSRNRRGRAGLIVSLMLMFIAGTIVAVCFVLLNARLFGGYTPAARAAHVIYFAIGVLCLLKVLDRALLSGSFRLARVPLDAWGRPKNPNQARALVTLVAQRLVMLAIILPYALALLVLYRPKNVHDGDPQTIAKLTYSPARFTSRDGLLLQGWWMPAAAETPAALEVDAAEQWGRRSVIICHGFGSGKEQDLRLARFLTTNGFNVLAFDFRATGDSGGRFISFGDRERLDVLAAAAWIKTQRPRQADRIFGIGLNTGAAALLAAATDADDGTLLDGIVLYEPYARLEALAQRTSEETLPGLLGWLADNVSMPIASLHAGTDLAEFAPAELAQEVWPRPLLVVHGNGATFVPVGEEMDVYREAMQPKQQFWPSGNYTSAKFRIQRARRKDELLTEMFRQWLGTSERLSNDAGVQHKTLQFLREAESVPVL
jgi:pimeloyl-ACP methyl ester carboxylesterase